MKYIESWIDYIIIAIIIFSFFVGLIRGFIHEILLLITWGFVFFIANHYYNFCLSFCYPIFKNKLTYSWATVIMLFIITLIIVRAINFLISQLLKRTKLTGIDKILGSCFGMIRGIIIAAMLLLFLDTFSDFSDFESWQKSQFIPWFNFITNWLLNCLQELIKFS